MNENEDDLEEIKDQLESSMGKDQLERQLSRQESRKSLDKTELKRSLSDSEPIPEQSGTDVKKDEQKVGTTLIEKESVETVLREMSV